MAVAKGIHSASVRILGTCWRTIRTAERAARHLGIRVTAAEHWTADYAASVSDFLETAAPKVDQVGWHERDYAVVVVLMEPDELASFMNQAVHKAAGRKMTWLMGSVGVIAPQTAAQWALDLTSSAFLVEPHLVELAGLAPYLQLNNVPHQPMDTEVSRSIQIETLQC